MTKQHFEAFAREIRSNRERNLITDAEARAAARVVCNVAQNFNPRFNADKFAEACGLSNLEEF